MSRFEKVRPQCKCYKDDQLEHILMIMRAEHISHQINAYAERENLCLEAKTHFFQLIATGLVPFLTVRPPVTLEEATEKQRKDQAYAINAESDPFFDGAKVLLRKMTDMLIET